MVGKIIFFLAILLFNNISNAQGKFELDAHVKGYEGKVKIILNFVMPNHEVDMDNEQELYMVDGRFRIEGQLSGLSLLSIRIRPEITENFDPTLFESAFIWVDNKKMTLYGEKAHFEYCDVTGCDIQDENERSQSYRRDKIKAYRNRIDSLSVLKSEAASLELQRMKSVSEIYLRNKYRLEFSYHNSNSFVSVYNYSWFVKWIPEMVPKSHAIGFYNLLEDSLKNSIHGKQIKNYIENVAVNRKLEIGDRPYEFSLPDSTGNQILLSSLNGKVVLLDFWASSCGPCRKEHENYSTVYDKFNRQGFVILSVSQDRRRGQWIKAMIKDNMNWPSVWDETMHITRYSYLVTGIPQNYLINRDGVIVGENIKGEDLEKSVRELVDLE